jgi:hypothetical protein
VVAKILAALSVAEPGDNFLSSEFRWDIKQEPMPGWELTTNMMVDEGFPARGHMMVDYFSGEGKGLKRCRPEVNFRKALLNLTLIRECDVVPEEDLEMKAGDPKKLPGRMHMKNYTTIWEKLLTTRYSHKPKPLPESYLLQRAAQDDDF